VANWSERKEVGDRHELRVKQELELRGWTVHPCGQGTYPPAIQEALGRTNSALRQFPDLIAACDTKVVTVDPKARLASTRTSRYAISCRCLLAGLQFLGTNAPIPLYYVFDDLGVLTPAEVTAYARVGFRPPSGSYYLINSWHARRFDEIFGLPTTRMTASA
jgi:hypothetical protein